MIQFGYYTIGNSPICYIPRELDPWNITNGGVPLMTDDQLNSSKC